MESPRFGGVFNVENPIPKNTRYAREHKKLGLCAVCPRPVESGQSRCRYHLYKCRTIQRDYANRNPAKLSAKYKKRTKDRNDNGQRSLPARRPRIATIAAIRSLAAAGLRFLVAGCA